MKPHMNGNKLDEWFQTVCPTLTCLSLKIKMVLFPRYFNSIALYKMNCIVLLLLYMYIVYYSPLKLI